MTSVKLINHSSSTADWNISVMYNPFVAYSTPFAYINYPICSRAIAVTPLPDNCIPKIKHSADLQDSNHSNRYPGSHGRTNKAAPG